MLMTALLVAALSAAHAVNAGQLEKGTLQVAGQARTFAIHTPDGLDPKQPAPLIVALHGGFGNSTRLLQNTTLQRLADQRHVILLLPEALGRAWLDARDASGAGEQDVVFIERLVDHVRESRNIDAQRVYLTGLSSGGEMTFRMALQRPTLFAAVATVSANLPDYMLQHIQPSGRVPIMMINGMADPLMPWDGGAVGGGRGTSRLGTVISARDTFARWADINGCEGEPNTITLPDLDPQDGTRVRRSAYRGCRDGADVVAIAIVGGGHSWPGAPRATLPARVVGTPSRDIDAAEVIWEFFEQHRGHAPARVP